MVRLRKSTKQYVIIVALSFLIIGAAFVAAYVLILKNIEKNYGMKLDTLSNELEENQRKVYEALEEIEAGTCITEDLLVYKTVLTSQGKETFIDQQDLGRQALVNIPKGAYIQKSMLAEDQIADCVRETAYDCIRVPEHMIVNDSVDVRISYPNGENYIVLSKKLLKACSENRAEWYLWLSEEEILLMSSAIVDAYLYSGSYLYATRYIEPAIQQKSVVNYQASLAAQELIRKNPNIVEIAQKELSVQLRKELENRLASSQKQEVGEVSWDVKTNRSQTAANTDFEDEDNFYYYSEEEEAKEKDQEYGE